MKTIAPFAVLAALASAACSPEPEDKAPAETPPPAAAAPAVPAPAAAAAVDPALDAWVRDYVKDGGMPLRYASAATTGPDALTLVYLLGGDYCGSGGCTLLVLTRNGDTFARLGHLTVVQTPIRVLTSQTHGRPDLLVGVRGSGTEPAQALIPFDGTRYTSNPTVAPAKPVEGAAPGQTLITDDTPKVTVRE